METIKGTIESMKKDRKGFKLSDGNWYSNSYLAELNCNRGDQVEVTYKMNGQYRNYLEVKILEKAKTNQVSKNDPTTMLVSYAKDLTVANGKSLKNNVVEILEAYSIVQQALSDENILESLIGNKEPEQESGLDEDGKY